MQESVLFRNINMIWKHTIANISCRLRKIVNIMQVGGFSIIRHGPVFILMVHNLDISEF
jgi:hypothetical protein